MCKGRMTFCTVANQWTSDYGCQSAIFEDCSRGGIFFQARSGKSRFPSVAAVNFITHGSRETDQENAHKVGNGRYSAGPEGHSLQMTTFDKVRLCFFQGRGSV
jgi:hypothetical protein